MKSESVYILSALRTPIGKYGGFLSTISAVQLGAVVVSGAVKEAGLDVTEIESIAIGQVLQANVGQAPARQVALAAGLPVSVCATTINKVCASGMKAISMICNDILLGNIELGVAGGMESMSLVPHYLPNARFGMGFGDKSVVDGVAHDGLTDAYNHASMGVAAEQTASTYHLSREQQDDYTEQSYLKSRIARDSGSFDRELQPVEIKQKNGGVIIINTDEGIEKADFVKMRMLKPAFSATGTVTAANASPLSDGASAMVLAGDAYVKRTGCQPSFKIVAYAEAEQEPLLFTTTPILAARQVLNKAGLSFADINYFEVNEAFAVVPLIFMKETGIPAERVNVHGGAVALGHPLGGSGARIVTSLLHILKVKNARYGLAVICNGGGGASAMIIENIKLKSGDQ